ncbi:hypothetical protein RRU94_05755 [Domibacillus sp. DTU_2020_1001157_1_SI_ALB_TIR_016]|nr:hypothetical protein [Domibacillus sp. DTU_2020_1001157_1_SI_ALB_TIR_016]WNS77980.1 hypothetical protein RRU94_05755 [Domibacillus sp. DTU_2020_1001157_1_SI_ALB_TIR_016]
MKKWKKIKAMLASETVHVIYMATVSVIMVIIIVYQLKIGAYPVNTE